MRVQISWGSDDTKKETKDFNSVQEMIDYAFNIYDRIILH